MTICMRPGGYTCSDPSECDWCADRAEQAKAERNAAVASPQAILDRADREAGR